MTAAASRTDPSGFYAFCALLDEAKARKVHDPMTVARHVWKKRYQEECPFMSPIQSALVVPEAAPARPAPILARPPVAPVVEPHLPMARLDFESYSEIELAGPEGVGAHGYWEHPSTFAFCMAFILPDEAPVVWIAPWAVGDGLGFNEDRSTSLFPLFDWILAGGLLEASNVEFERCAWARMERDFGWPHVRPEQWRDSMALYCANGLPRSLGKAAAALGVAEQKSKAGHQLMMKLCKPAPAIKDNANPRRLHTLPNILALGDYCIQDVKTEAAVVEPLPPLSPSELGVWQLTATMNDRGLPIDVESANVLSDLLSITRQEWDSRLREATHDLLGVDNITAREDVMAYLTSRGTPVYDMTKATVEKLLEPEHVEKLPADVRLVLEARASVGKSSTAKIGAMLRRTCADGRARGSLIYHGAGPGRWSGAGIQPQNLPKDKVDSVDEVVAYAREVVAGRMTLDRFRMMCCDPYQAVAGCIRGMICASPGHVFQVADYSQIEARIVLWAFGDPGLSLFASGVDVYKEMAGSIYHRDPSTIEKPSKERDIGKETVLGGGFGMGSAKFYSRCQQKGIIITPEESDACITGYRTRFPRVPAGWKDVERCAVSAIRNPGYVFPTAKVAYCFDGKHLRCRLPSGRKIVYPFAEIGMRPVPWDKNEMRPCVTYMGMIKREGTDGQDGGEYWGREETYGGKLTENFVQAMARDIMADAMLRCEARGLPVILSVHDEVVCEVPEQASLPLKEFEKFVAEAPAWAKGLPVKSEGYIGRRYMK